MPSTNNGQQTTLISRVSIGMIGEYYLSSAKYITAYVPVTASQTYV